MRAACTPNVQRRIVVNSRKGRYTCIIHTVGNDSLKAVHAIGNPVAPEELHLAYRQKHRQCHDSQHHKAVEAMQSLAAQHKAEDGVEQREADPPPNYIYNKQCHNK